VEIGHSIVETLIQMRLRQAALLLQHSNRNATEIAQDVGFQNYNHFANHLKNIMLLNREITETHKINHGNK
jgi:AraC family transcriptional regulator of arabinose operon